MSVDLLKLDNDCAMPNLLRAKWKALYGYDPLTAERRRNFFACTALVGLLGVLFMILLGGAIFQSNMFVGIGLMLIPVTIMLASLCFLFGFGKQSSKFADALEKLARVLELQVDSLHKFRQEELANLANKKLTKQTGAVLEEEHLLRQVLTKKDNPTWNLQSAVETRKQFSEMHKVFKSWELAEEKWDQYFAQAEQSLSPALAESDGA